VARTKIQDRLPVKLVILAGRDFLRDNCSLMAASIAYYVLFSLFPLLILAVTIVGFLMQDVSFQERILNILLQYIPAKNIGTENLLMREIRTIAQAGGKAFGIIGLLGLAWSGSNMFGVIRTSVNIAFNIQSERPFYRKKMLDFTMMLMTGFIFVLSILSTTVIQALDVYTGYIPYIGNLVRTVTWQIGSFFIPIFISMIAFFLIYKVLPARKTSFRNIWPGVLVATLLFEAGKFGFGFYLQNFGKYDVIFGSLGAIISFLLWVYISAAILLFGAEVASEYARLKKAPRS
jgi:membrane protein